MAKVSKSEDIGLSIFLVLITLGLFLLVPGGRMHSGGPLQTAFLSVFFFRPPLPPCNDRKPAYW